MAQVRRRGLLALLPIALLAACARHTADFHDPGQPIAARIGQAFRITLDANPTTGYNWRLAAPLPDVVALVDARYFRSPNLAHLIGAGGREVWTFQAIRRGDGQIQLDYARSAGPPGRTATFTVSVR